MQLRAARSAFQFWPVAAVWLANDGRRTLVGSVAIDYDARTSKVEEFLSVEPARDTRVAVHELGFCFPETEHVMLPRMNSYKARTSLPASHRRLCTRTPREH